MEFYVNDKHRLKIIDKRYQYEKKWWGFRWSVRIILVGGIIASFVYLCRFFLNIGLPIANMFILGMVIPITFLVPFFLKMIARSTVSSWVTDLFSETLEIRDGVIIRGYSLSLGAGYMNLIEGKDRVIMHTNLTDIHNLKIYEKSGRIQFNATTRITYYNDWKNKVLESDEVVEGFLNVYYNYYEPDLIDFLKKSGIPYIEGDMNYKRGQ